MRVIPCLLMKEGFLVKGKNFINHRYIGDPINAARIFSNKEVDEIMFLDISASLSKKDPDFDLIENVADECYTPFAVGGGIRTIEHIRKILYAGAEKVCLNTIVCEKPDFVEEAAKTFGSQAIVVSIDVCQEDDGSYTVYSHSGTRRTHYNLFDYVKLIEASGAGEILINSIDRDGTKKGYDIELIKQVSDSVKLPVIALGGASGIKNFEEVLHYTLASAVAAGALFVFHGSRDAVLIQYPNSNELKKLHKL